MEKIEIIADIGRNMKPQVVVIADDKFYLGTFANQQLADIFIKAYQSEYDVKIECVNK